MKIRLATVDDLPVLTKLVAHAAAELEEKFGTPRMDGGLLTCIRYGIDTKQAVVVAEQEGEIVGWCARVHLPGSAPGHAEGLGTWVHEPFRRERVARDMREEADKRARICGMRYVTGVAAKGNVAGLESCLAEGYRVVGHALRKDL